MSRSGGNKLLLSFSELNPNDPNREDTLTKYYNQVLEYLKIKGIIWSKREIKHHLMLVDTDKMVEAAQIATKIPGVKYSAIVESTLPTFDDIVDKIAKVGKILIEPRETFTIKADLENPLSFSSRDIEFAASARIIGESSEMIKPNKKIPSKTIYVKVLDDLAFVFYYKYTGLGGWPMGYKGKALFMMQGDAYDALSVWMMLRQGIFPHMLLFDTRPFTKQSDMTGAIKIISYLREFLPIKNYIMPVIKSRYLFKHLKNSPQRLIPTLFERMLLRIATSYAETMNINSIISGKTIKNDLRWIEDILGLSSSLGKRMFFPLIGLDPQEIKICFEKMGLLSLSTRMNKFPESLYLKEDDYNDILKIEKRLNIQGLIEEGLKHPISLNLRTGYEDLHTILDDYYSK
jgi:adenylyl- and sulfurtransferase ThiI